VTAVRFFLKRFREEAGSPQDAVEKILIDQLAVAHLKVGELYALSAESLRTFWLSRSYPTYEPLHTISG
jgi:hypothetical protein